MELADKIKLLPDNPGVYRYLDSGGKVIYVGKAKNLRKRVSQYFTAPDRLTRKTRALVAHIADIEHTVVESEEDAFLLENNLIKQYQPRYNILLKDSKTYPWICVKKQSFPKIFLTRKVVRDGSLYFGPYSSATHARQLLELIYSLYKIRTCNLALTEKLIADGKFKRCLNYYIKRCDAPCTGDISKEEYDSRINEIIKLLKGHTGELMQNFRRKMKEAAGSLEFEKAQTYKEDIEMLRKHYGKSVVANTAIMNLDVFALAFRGYDVFGNYFRINEGCIIQALNLQLKMNIEENREDVLGTFMQGIYDIIGDTGASEVIVPFIPGGHFRDKEIHIPLKGEKYELLQLCIKNAKAFEFMKLKEEQAKYPDSNSPNRAVIQLKRDLNMQQPPVHIECFDNSNIQGTNPVGSCVVFRNGRPSKRDYRHFNIKSVVGANDFASMKEIVFRRYSRLLEEDEDLPQLVLIDGGKGQLHFAYDALCELGLQEQIKVIGIAKRMEELIIPGDPNPLALDKNSSSLKLLMHLRDEAHRFGITHHRNKRSKTQIDSELRSIPGIGEATETKLLRKFKSVKRIAEATVEEISAVTGPKLAGKIHSTLNGRPS
ncbi:MAG: excinuclease ABC subunit UvrC [Bacteroidales bacterium]|jgi:excinuclease ABC subunit C|nr:excinuclease ABC subunit UvrC [Bacteroidales bacterium]